MSNIKLPVSKVPGIGPVSAHALCAQGLDTAAALSLASLETISSVPGFGVARAARVKQAATRLLGNGASEHKVTRASAGRAKTNGARAKPLTAAIDKTDKKTRKAEKQAAKARRKSEKAERKQAKKAARKEQKLVAKAQRKQARKAAKAERKQAKKAAKAAKAAKAPKAAKATKATKATKAKHKQVTTAA